MHELAIEQHHFNAFQGSSTHKSYDFKRFLNDIKIFAADNNRKPIQIFFSYAWPRNNTDGEEWHTNFIKMLAINLGYAGLIIHNDQLHSGPGHELNPFMQKIKTSDRVYVFRSKTYDYKISLPISGIVHENNLINECKVEKSISQPFIIHISLSNECKKEPNSEHVNNAPVCTDYLLLLKWLISEAYHLDSTFEVFWQNKLREYKIRDNLLNVPHLEPNIIRRAGLLNDINIALSKYNMLVCRGREGSGKTQLLISFIWENYYNYNKVYYFSSKLTQIEEIKSGSLLIFDNVTDQNFIDPLLSRSDIKIIITTRNLRLYYPSATTIDVNELTSAEARELIINTLGNDSASECEALIQLSLDLKNLSFACGTIQRLTHSISKYIQLYQSDAEALSKFLLKPIREPQIFRPKEITSTIEITHTLSVPKPPQLEKVVSCSHIKPQIAEPLPDDEKKEKLRFEEQQQFLKKEGHEPLLKEVCNYDLKKNVTITTKAIFISFASPPDTLPQEEWTVDFVDAFVNDLRLIGFRIYYQQSSLQEFIKENLFQMDNIHVFIIGSRFRDISDTIKLEDEQILQCLNMFPRLDQPDRRFIVPIMLTSQKHFNPAYERYAAHSFYELAYAKSLRIFLGFICGFDENFENFWIKNSLKHKIESNWWPNRPPELPHFVGRQCLLTDMQNHFFSNKDLLVLSAWHGIGGVGKTQLAIKFAHLYGYEYSLIFYFRGESKIALIEQYVQLGIDREILTAEDKRPIDERASKIKSWMENTLPAGWLLIIDDAPNYEEIKDWLPAKGGKVLITSRHTEWPGPRNIRVELFTIDEGNEYINKVLTKSVIEQDLQATKNFIELLGTLPLVLAQACAYINKNAISLAEYLKIYKALFEKNELPSDQYQKAIAVTWNITLEQMMKEDLNAVELLYCCTHLHHEQIPKDSVKYFFNYADENMLFLNTINAMRVASEYSMILIDEQNQTFTLHSLAQQVIRDQLIKENKDVDYLDRSANAVLTIFPYTENKEQMADYSVKKALKLHLENILNYLDNCIKSSKLIDNEKMTTLLKHRQIMSLIYLADAYRIYGDENRRKILLERASILMELHNEKDQLGLARVLANLAGAYYALGNAHKTVELCERSIAIFESNCGNEHIEKAKVLNNLAQAYAELGNPLKEIWLLEQSLAIFDLHYERENIEVTKTLVNLAKAYSVKGDARKQRDLIKKMVEIEESFYGKEHVQVASTLNLLASVYGILGETRKHKELAARALTIYERFYSKEHVNVVASLETLADAYGSLGKAHKKKILLERALRIKEKYYGKKHVRIAYTLTNLACAHGDLGDTQSKKLILEQALDIIESFYGKKHIERVKVLCKLANAYHKLGNAHKTKELIEFAIPILEQHYGKNHIEVAVRLAELASAYRSLGDAHKSKELSLQALKIYEEFYGREHVKTTAVLITLANAYGDLGDVNTMKETLERALQIRVNYYGIGNINIATILNNLGNAYGNLGDLSKKKELLEKALLIKENFHGAEHPEVAETLCNLVNYYLSLNNINNAIYHAERAYTIFLKHPDCGTNHPLTQKVKAFLDQFKTQQLISINEAKLSYGLCRGMFSKPETTKMRNPLDDIMRKYQLPDSSNESLQKGLKIAANNNNHEDLKYFIESGCNIDAQDSGNMQRTALHCAVIKNAKPCVKILLEFGAKYNIPDGSGKTAYQYAVINNNKEIISLFSTDKVYCINYVAYIQVLLILGLMLGNFIFYCIDAKTANAGLNASPKRFP